MSRSKMAKRLTFAEKLTLAEWLKQRADDEGAVVAKTLTKLSQDAFEATGIQATSTVVSSVAHDIGITVKVTEGGMSLPVVLRRVIQLEEQLAAEKRRYTNLEARVEELERLYVELGTQEYAKQHHKTHHKESRNRDT